MAAMRGRRPMRAARACFHPSAAPIRHNAQQHGPHHTRGCLWWLCTLCWHLSQKCVLPAPGAADDPAAQLHRQVATTAQLLAHCSRDGRSHCTLSSCPWVLALLGCCVAVRPEGCKVHASSCHRRTRERNAQAAPKRAGATCWLQPRAQGLACLTAQSCAMVGSPVRPRSRPTPPAPPPTPRPHPGRRTGSSAVLQLVWEPCDADLRPREAECQKGTFLGRLRLTLPLMNNPSARFPSHLKSERVLLLSFLRSSDSASSLRLMPSERYLRAHTSGGGGEGGVRRRKKRTEMRGAASSAAGSAGGRWANAPLRLHVALARAGPQRAQRARAAPHANRDDNGTRSGTHLESMVLTSTICRSSTARCLCR